MKINTHGIVQCGYEDLIVEKCSFLHDSVDFQIQKIWIRKNKYTQRFLYFLMCKKYVQKCERQKFLEMRYECFYC